MQIRVDPEKCEANALCMAVAPDVFELTDDDALRIVAADVPADRLSDVERAVRVCPKQALELVHESDPGPRLA